MTFSAPMSNFRTFQVLKNEVKFHDLSEFFRTSGNPVLGFQMFVYYCSGIHFCATCSAHNLDKEYRRPRSGQERRLSL